MSAVAARKRGFEALVLAALIALLGGCAGSAKPPRDASIQLSPGERALTAAWRAERGMSEGDAMSNVMLRRYAAKGHAVRYAGDGLYEVMDRKAGKDVIATFYVTPPRR